MKDVNKVILLGRLGKAPVLRTTQEGTTVARLAMATSRRIPKKDGVEGEWEEETQWHDLVVWGRLAGLCGEYLHKGSPLYVEGFLKHRKYENQKKETRYAHEVHVEEMSFLPSISRKNTEGAAAIAAKSPESIQEADLEWTLDQDVPSFESIDGEKSEVEQKLAVF
jgi:single-strand DNA-binding protein